MAGTHSDRQKHHGASKEVIVISALLRVLPGDVLIGIILLFIEAKMWVDAAEFPENAQFYPKILLVCTFVLTVAVIIKGWRKRKKDNDAPSVLNIKVVGMIAIIVAYLIAIYLLGYLLATITFGIVAMAYLGMRNLKILISVPVIAGVLLYLLFTQLLYVPLPTGVLMDLLGF